MKILIFITCVLFAVVNETKKTENRKEYKIKINDKADTKSIEWSIKS